MSALPPTSPITPRLAGIETQYDDEIIELYEQDNVVGSSMSKSSLTLQQEIEQVGKVGLYLVEEIKAKNQLIEDLAGRLRMIYSSPNTPDLTLGGSGHPDSFLSSIRPTSSGTVSPMLPPAVLNECMDRAEKEIARLDEQVLVQSREIDCLRQDLAAATDQLAAERDQFKEDRVKLKKEIMELQVVVKRKDQFNLNALVKAKDRLTSVSTGCQISSADLDGQPDFERISRELKKRLASEEQLTESLEEQLEEVRKKLQTAINERDGYRVSLERVSGVEKSDQELQADFGDVAELATLRETLDGMLSREFSSSGVQTTDATTRTYGTQSEVVWSSLTADADEKARIFSQAIEDERAVYHAELERIETILADKEAMLARIEETRIQARSIAISTDTSRIASFGCNTEVPELLSRGTGDDFPRRFVDETVQTAPIDDVAALTEENHKLRDKYMKYRSEYAAVVEKRKSAVAIGSNTDRISAVSFGTGTEDIARAIDRGTSKTPQIVADSVVQVDDDRDEKLFLVESDLHMVAEDREALLIERERLMTELIRVSEERDVAVSQWRLQHVDHGSLPRPVEKQMGVSVGVITEADQKVPQPAVTETVGTDPVVLSQVSVGTEAAERPKLKTTGTDPVVFVVAEVLEQLSTGVDANRVPLVDVSIGGRTYEQSDCGVGEDETIVMKDAQVEAQDESAAHIIEQLQNEVVKLRTRADVQLDELKRELEMSRARPDLLEKELLSLERELAILRERPVHAEHNSGLRAIPTVDMSTETAIQDAFSDAATPMLDTSDLSPTSLAVRLDEYFLSGHVGMENQLIRSLQKRLMVSEKAMKEKNDFFKAELTKLRQDITKSAKTTTETGCNTEKNPMSPSMPKLLVSDSSPRPPRTSLDARDMVAFYQLGEPQKGIAADVSPTEADISEISKPLASITTACSPGGGATFDFSISSLGQEPLSSLSPLRIPFATPVAKDRDGDVVMRTAPRTQIRRAGGEDIVVLSDKRPIAETIKEESAEEIGNSVFESAAGDTVQSLQERNAEMRNKLRSVREKSALIGAMTNRLWNMTGIVLGREDRRDERL